MKTLQQYFDSKPLSHWLHMQTIDEKPMAELNAAETIEMNDYAKSVKEVWEAENSKPFPKDGKATDKIAEGISLNLNLYISVKRGHMKVDKPFSAKDGYEQSFSLTEAGTKHVENDILPRYQK